jgi:SAM-dependent methyltransferase
LARLARHRRNESSSSGGRGALGALAGRRPRCTVGLMRHRASLHRSSVATKLGVLVSVSAGLGLYAAALGAESELTRAARRPELAMPGDLPPLPEVPYVPTPMEVVHEMLRLAGAGQGDVVFDLGCGDGRIVIAAVEEHGVDRGVCVEIDPALVAEARDNATAAGVEDRIRFVEGDLFGVDLSDATVVTLYLLPDVNLRLRPKLLHELRPGTRVVSHAFDMGDWEPERSMRVKGKNVFLWTIPVGRGGDGS